MFRFFFFIFNSSARAIVTLYVSISVLVVI